MDLWFSTLLIAFSFFLAGCITAQLMIVGGMRRKVEDLDVLVNDLHRFVGGKVYRQVQLRRSIGIPAAAEDAAQLRTIIQAVATCLPPNERTRLERHINRVLAAYDLPKFFLNCTEENEWIDRTEGNREPWPKAVKEEWR